ncbi:copper resistance protein CopC [Niveispirillum sp. KHB5.9]|uniref:copper resistance protein CopC n=1 Tax=Niveispirillum sp. KHB5.9 TaxID=3400269 RepID=UPI003A865366
MRIHRLFTAAALSLLLTAPALAHPKLKAADPAVDSTGPAPATLSLSFSEKLTPGKASVTLSPAPAGGVTVTDGADEQSLTVTPKAKLAPGSYKVDWAVIAANGHESAGSYQITVK